MFYRGESLQKVQKEYFAIIKSIHMSILIIIIEIYIYMSVSFEFKE